MSQNSDTINFDLDKFLEEELFDEKHEEMGRYILEQYNNPSRNIVPRDRVGGAERLYNDYFSTTPVYPDHIFRRRFRMRKELFCRIVDALVNHTTYFQQRVDAAKVKGLSPLQKCIAAIRILAYGTPADAIDEYIKIGETTTIECFFKFCTAIIEVFGEQYMRKPNANDVQRLLKMHEECHGFPGMLGSLDCMHWAWKNCPTGWKGQYTRGDHGYPTVMLEAVASVDLWIWHTYFGVAGSNNDLNVLSRSNLFQDKLQGIAPEVRFTVNGIEYKTGYYLVDGIYPEWAAFVKSFPHPRDPKRLLFKERQESARKDVERAFGVLQSRFAIVCGPARSWHKKRLHNIMDTCIILHNMIVEDERHTYSRNFSQDNFSSDAVNDVQQGHNIDFETYLARDATIRDRLMHHQLKADLMEHIWTHFGNQN
ncbi:protein ANTAGONIST OF LIKE HETEROCHROMATIN PROTEIN 1-like [Silene latifolia]|uniref:protein ANTAGONIST OF LIKE HETEROCHROMATIN PROTEIN 1-like n=1 Tax=Silene latifolia TaxID=37657 RepID=UPI003D7896EF